MAELRLRVVTPEGVKFDDDVDMVIMRCETGDMGILPQHEPCSATLDYGVLRVLMGGEERGMAVFGGIAQVLDNVVTILANEAQWPDDFANVKLEEEREEAERRLLEESEDDDKMHSNQILLRRTLVKIEVSAYPLISKIESDSGDDSGSH
jgi:F-type H+-transporting ATPase subunit epsilon